MTSLKPSTNLGTASSMSQRFETSKHYYFGSANWLEMAQESRFSCVCALTFVHAQDKSVLFLFFASCRAAHRCVT